MSRVRTKDTAPEIALRRELHSRGYRYRVDHPLPGMTQRRADLLFSKAKVAVFIDGCFWHGCPDHFITPKSNRDWWRAKIDANRSRDRSTDEHLLSLGWAVVRFWEHDEVGNAADHVAAVVDARSSS